MNDRFAVPGVGPETALGVAAPIILSAKAAPLFRLEDSARGGMDADAIHDMRVASRRLREAMRLLSSVYPRAAWKRSYVRVRRATRILGPVRDSDVFIQAFARMSADLGEGGGRAVAFLVGRRTGQRDCELARLDRELSRLDLRHVRKDFVRFADSVEPGPEVGLPLVAFAHAAIAERASLVSGLQPRAVDESRTGDHHALRILYKRLRYAVEILAPCYGDEFDALHDLLTAFQDSLGNLHDLHFFQEAVAAPSLSAEAAPAGVTAADLREVREWLEIRAGEALEGFARLAEADPADSLMAALLSPLDPRSAHPRAGEGAGGTGGDGCPEAGA